MTHNESNPVSSTAPAKAAMWSNSCSGGGPLKLGSWTPNLVMRPRYPRGRTARVVGRGWVGIGDGRSRPARAGAGGERRAGACWGRARQAWPPFVLVTGLLLVGGAAASDGLFEAAGSCLARLPGGGLVLFGALMLLVAAVTAVLNLDTSVVFLTPVLVHAARRRGIGDVAFLYGAVFMSNSASLLLPGSNLTNLLVLSHSRLSGGAFAAQLFPSWVASIVVTAGVVVVWRWHDLRAPETGRETAAPFRLGLGLPAVIAAAVLVLALQDPAVPVLVLGVVVVALEIASGRRLDPRRALRAVGVPTLAGLFVLVVALGTLAVGLGHPGTADGVDRSLADGTARSRHRRRGEQPARRDALVLPPTGSRRGAADRARFGPNLVVTGALSAILWLRVARSEGAKPSVWTYTKVGAVLVPLSMATALAALELSAHGAV